MRHTLLPVLFLACAILPHLGQAQTIQTSLPGDVCPKKTYTYTLSTACSSYTWTVAGGSITRGQGTSAIDVVWNDVPTTTGTPLNSTNVKVVVGGCAGTAPVVPALNVFVSSISDKTPGPLAVNGIDQGNSYTIPFGDTPILTLRVPVVPVPVSGGNSTYGALTYNWIIPLGWKYVTSNGTVLATSDGTTTRRFTTNSTGTVTGDAGNAIYVQPSGNTPLPSASASISVQAINNNCVGAAAGADNSVSKILTVSVTRGLPLLTIISDKTPNGGNFNLLCGDKSDYHFRSTSSGGPSGGSFSNYAFVFSGPITPTGTVNSATPATNFTGATGQVGVTLTAQYNRNGYSGTIYAPNNLSINAQTLPKPTISGLPSSAPGKFPSICQPISLTAVSSGANTYTWAVTGGLGLGSTTGSTVTVYPGSSRGTGSITVTASNTNAPAGTCQTSSDVYNVNVNYNPASGTYTSSSNSTPMALNESYQFAQANNTYYIIMDQNLTFTFSTMGPNNTPGPNIISTGPKTAQFTFTGSSVQVIATATDSSIPCGQTSLTSVFVAPYNFSRSPNPASTELTVTDNSPTENSQPAIKSQYAFKNADKIPTGGPIQAFDATLYDMYGKLVKSQVKVMGKTVINVSDVPAGLYNLRISNGKYVQTEHVQITH